MKPTISFVLQPSPSTAYENLEAIARNLLDGLDVLLDSGLVKCSIFLDGPTLGMLQKVAKPLMFGKIRSGVQEGILEFLGGGFYDPMLPIFPEKMQSLQLESHRNLLKKIFDVEPQGYFNSSLVWEMGMVSVLSKSGFDYALVRETAIRDALGRSTPVSGWFTVEDKGTLMRIVPVSDDLSRAIETDDLNWRNIAMSYCREGKSAVVMLDLPPVAAEIVPFFERLVDFVETNDLRTWPVGYSVNQLATDGSLSYLMSAGRMLGLPPSATTCREMLIRRPEINLLQKSFLDLFRRGRDNLDEKSFDEFCEILSPAMSPLFFRDLGDDRGMQSLSVREWGFRYLVDASKRLDDLMKFTGLRLEVCDYLLQGRKQICFENSEMSGLLDFFAGGVLRNLFFKPSSVNLLNGWRNDGEPTLAFLDCLLPNVDLTPTQVDQILSGRENLLRDPYEYQIKRGENRTEITLMEEQTFSLGDQRGIFQVEKTFGLEPDSSRLTACYNVKNSTYVNSKCFFGTLFELGMFANDSGDRIVIDGFDLKWDKKTPVIYPEAKRLEIRDHGIGCSMTFEFDAPAAVFVGPILGASSSAAAPDAFQGIRVYPFFRTALTVSEEKNFGIRVSVVKR